MNIVTTRFGLIQVQESDLYRIPDGLVGFRAFTQFVLLPDPVTAGLRGCNPRPRRTWPSG